MRRMQISRLLLPPPNEIAITRRVVDVADARHGIVRTDHLRLCGASADWIRWQTHRGWLNRQHRGVFLAGMKHPTRFGRWVAATDALGEGSMLLGTSGAVCWEMVDLRRLTNIDDVYVPSNRRSRPTVRARQLSWLDDVEPCHVDGIPIAPRAAVLVSIATILEVPHFIRALERGQFHEPGLPDAVARIVDGSPGVPGAARILHALERFGLGDHGVASGFEFDIDADLERLGAPPALRNATLQLPDGGLLRVDRYWEGARFLLEADHRQHRYERNMSIDLGRDARASLAQLDVTRIPHWLPASERRVILASVAERACEQHDGPEIYVVRHG